MDFWRILIFLLILFNTYSALKNFKKKVKKAEGEEEIRHAVVRLLLIIILFLIAIAVFIF